MVIQYILICNIHSNWSWHSHIFYFPSLTMSSKLKIALLQQSNCMWQRRVKRKKIQIQTEKRQDAELKVGITWNKLKKAHTSHCRALTFSYLMQQGDVSSSTDLYQTASMTLTKPFRCLFIPCIWKILQLNCRFHGPNVQYVTQHLAAQTCQRVWQVRLHRLRRFIDHTAETPVPISL